MTKLLRLISSMLLALWVLTPAWADDTEIFFGGGGGGVDASPNVLFVLDTSGSMSSRPDGAPRNSDSKINILKDAMTQLVNQVNDVNIGLMRFSNPGGPVLYPVTYIDKETTGQTGTIGVLADASQDGRENLVTSAVILDETDLAIGESPSNITGGGGSGSGSQYYDQYITSDKDDAVQEYDRRDEGRTDWSDYMCFGGVENRGGNCGAANRRDTPNDLMGLVFPDVEIPAGAVISDVRLELMVRDSGDRDFYADVYVEAPNARDFDRGDDISERNRLPLSVSWRMNDGRRQPSDGEQIESPNLAEIVQQAVDHPNWGATSGDLGFILQVDRRETDDSAFRTFHNYGGRRTTPARLVIRYDEPNVGGGDNHLAAIKFNRVDVPLGVTVTSANLVLTPSSDTAVASSVTVSLESTDDPADLVAVNGDISRRLAGASGTNVSFDANGWQNGEPVSLNVTSLLNSRVKRADWCGGEAMTFLVGTEEATRFFSASESGGGLAPRLEIQYDGGTIVPGSSCLDVALSKQITDSADDGESSGGSLSTSSRIDIDRRGSGVFRFSDLQLPASAKVKAAYLTLQANRDSSGDTDFTISIENVGNSNPMGGDGIDGRSFSGSVSWAVAEDWNGDSTYQSPDIKALIDRVMGAGWRSGNALTLKVDYDSGNGRNVSAYEDNPLSAATLRVVFEDDGSFGVGTARREIIEVISNLSADGYTPIQDTLFEAQQYYTGKNVVWGKFRGGHDTDGSLISSGAAKDGPFSYTRTSVQGAIQPSTFQGNVLPAGCPSTDSSDRACEEPNARGMPEGEHLVGSPVYQSPIVNECQVNSHIVFLTDGQANEPHSESLIRNVIGTNCDRTSDSAEACVVELAEWMHTTDVSSMTGNQHITTHMVGFDYDSPWLEEVARAGGGEYKTATDLNSLVTEFRAILASVMKTNTSFVAPVSAINQFNRLTNLNDVYFAVFRPDSVPHWTGNLKRYQLGTSGGQSNMLLDANRQNAVDPDTGFFSPTSQSFWSSGVDGAEVELGGANENLPSYNEMASGARKLYTDIAGGNLSATGNRIATTNLLLTPAALGVGILGAADQIAWIRGMDVDDEDVDGVTNEFRHVVADPLHSRPVAINYGAGASSDVTLYFGTNAGMLHAVSGETGEEVFGYIPEELLPLQVDLRENSSSNNHFYGIDGSPAVWTNDGNTAGIRPGDSEDFVRLYFGQRRGGRNYYAMDVTDRANPKLLWKIEGGTGSFSELGQSWGRPVPGKINIDGNDRDVVFLSGGYDPSKDGTTTRNTDGQGRAVYIVDAITGARLWAGGPSGGVDTVFPDMQYSIPAGLTVIDVDGDGYDDAFYVGDTGGQLWRFDIHPGKPVADLVTGGVIADLAIGGDSSPLNNRRFYHSPDVALVEVEEKLKLAISIGSGARPSPLSEGTLDRFYVVFQDTIYGAPASYDKLFEADDPTTGTVETSDFYDATANLLQTGTAAEISAETLRLNAASGWYMDLNRSGEKVLSTPLSFRNTVAFTTYEPRNASNSCTPKAGTSRIYQVDLISGTAPNVWGSDEPLPEPKRDYELDTPSIIDEPVIICTGDGCDLFAGPEQPPIDTLNTGNIQRASWRQDG